MSKAFTTDSDDDGFLEPPALPPGTRNYMTKAGAVRLKAEVEALSAERRRLAATVEGQARAQVIERRLRYVLPRLEALQIVDPLEQPKDTVLFGATVTVSENGGAAETWRIVGLDEMDLERGWISWMSPLASALLGKKTGDLVLFQKRRLTVQGIAYQAGGEGDA